MIEKYFYEEFGMESLKFKRFISENFPQQEISLNREKMRKIAILNFLRIVN
jgi:hypothetical protein